MEKVAGQLHAPSAFSQRNRSVDRPQRRCRHFGEDKYLFHLTRIKPRTVQPIYNRLYICHKETLYTVAIQVCACFCSTEEGKWDDEVLGWLHIAYKHKWQLCVWNVASAYRCTGTPSCGQVKEAPNYINSWTIWHLTVVPVGCPETSLTNCQSALSNIPEKRRST